MLISANRLLTELIRNVQGEKWAGWIVRPKTFIFRPVHPGFVIVGRMRIVLMYRLLTQLPIVAENESID